ncbi:hypothetical protein [Microbacterium sp. XT11]|uniref:hypothetical protein n=1 Tax=Microbacterium sp. XT11 TaxID=367477 RepID=UPI000743098F|nr:hypothetical protein [Microbacterium sp. XT11]ALX67187.1 hypothetical protein AB663_002941 [Microbacterium sp. XT11]
MDRKLALNAQLAIAQGHRVEVIEVTDPETRAPVVMAVVDLDTGIRYRRAEDAQTDAARWLGRVLECTVTIGGHGAHTVLTVAPEQQPATGAKAALLGADAAVEAAKAEADRWGGTDRSPEEPPQRIW